MLQLEFTQVMEFFVFLGTVLLEVFIVIGQSFLVLSQSLILVVDLFFTLFKGTHDVKPLFLGCNNLFTVLLETFNHVGLRIAFVLELGHKLYSAFKFFAERLYVVFMVRCFLFYLGVGFKC